MTTAMTSRNAATLDAVRLSFAGLIRSEWIKLRTLRSTVWCYALIVAVTIGLGVLIAVSMRTDVGSSADSARQMTVTVSTVSANFTQLIAVVLGVLVIAGEYRTGMIRSTLTAAPGRTGAYLAKVLVLAATTFVVVLVGIAVTAAVTAPMLSGKGIAPALNRADVLLPMVGAAAYLALMAAIAFTVGAIVRNTAGGIASIVGLLLVLPVVLQVLMGIVHDPRWVENIATLLPAAAGAHLYQYVPAEVVMHGQPGVIMLNAWGDLAVLLGWLVVLGGLGLVLLKRRDA